MPHLRKLALPVSIDNEDELDAAQALELAHDQGGQLERLDLSFAIDSDVILLNVSRFCRLLLASGGTMLLKSNDDRKLPYKTFLQQIHG